MPAAENFLLFILIIPFLFSLATSELTLDKLILREALEGKY